MFKLLSIKNKEPALEAGSMVSLNEGLKKVVPFLIIHPSSFFSFSQLINSGQEFYQLNRLELSNLKIPTQKVQSLRFLLENMTRLLSLSLTNMALDDKTAKTILDGLPTSLVVLDLSYNRIKNGICFSGDQKIWQYLRNVNLRNVNLSGNKINPLGLTHFSDMLKHQKTIPLRFLSLKANQINDHGVIRFSQHFKALTSLFSLDLSDNQITDDGGITLFVTLSTLQSLKKLKLKQNPIDISEMLLKKTVHEMPYLQISIDRKRKPIKSV